MLKRCPVCETEFKSNNLNQKYCSKVCRLERVRERDRIRKRKERQEAREIQTAEDEKQRRIKLEQRQKEHEKIQQKRAIELNEKVAAGDPLAKMSTAKLQSLEYWEAYQDYHVEYAERWNRESRRIVNDVSVHDPGFAEKVIMAIEELGHVKTDMMN